MRPPAAPAQPIRNAVVAAGAGVGAAYQPPPQQRRRRRSRGNNFGGRASNAGRGSVYVSVPAPNDDEPQLVAGQQPAADGGGGGGGGTPNRIRIVANSASRDDRAGSGGGFRLKPHLVISPTNARANNPAAPALPFAPSVQPVRVLPGGVASQSGGGGMQAESEIGGGERFGNDARVMSNTPTQFGVPAPYVVPPPSLRDAVLKVHPQYHAQQPHAATYGRTMLQTARTRRPAPLPSGSGATILRPVLTAGTMTVELAPLRVLSTLIPSPAASPAGAVATATMPVSGGSSDSPAFGALIGSSPLHGPFLHPSPSAGGYGTSGGGGGVPVEVKIDTNTPIAGGAAALSPLTVSPSELKHTSPTAGAAAAAASAGGETDDDAAAITVPAVNADDDQPSDDEAAAADPEGAEVEPEPEVVPDAVLEIGAALKPLPPAPILRPVPEPTSVTMIDAGAGGAAGRVFQFEPLPVPVVGAGVPAVTLAMEQTDSGSGELIHAARLHFPPQRGGGGGGGVDRPQRSFATAAVVAGGDARRPTHMVVVTRGHAQPMRHPNAASGDGGAGGIEYSELSHLNPAVLVDDDADGGGDGGNETSTTAVDPRDAVEPTRLSGPRPLAAAALRSGASNSPRRNWRVRVEQYSLAWWLHRIGWGISAAGFIFTFDPLSIFGLVPYGISLGIFLWEGMASHLVVSVWLQFTVAVLYRRTGQDMPLWQKRTILSVPFVYLLANCLLYYVPKYVTGLDKWTALGSMCVCVTNLFYAIFTPLTYFRIRDVLRAYIERRAASNESSRSVAVDYSTIDHSMASLRRFVIAVTLSAVVFAGVYGLGTIYGVYLWITEPQRPYRKPAEHGGTLTTLMECTRQLVTILVVRASWIPISPIRTPSTVAAAEAANAAAAAAAGGRAAPHANPRITPPHVAPVVIAAVAAHPIADLGVAPSHAPVRAFAFES